jgi:hypothetical protein
MRTEFDGLSAAAIALVQSVPGEIHPVAAAAESTIVAALLPHFRFP